MPDPIPRNSQADDTADFRREAEEDLEQIPLNPPRAMPPPAPRPPNPFARPNPFAPRDPADRSRPNPADQIRAARPVPPPAAPRPPSPRPVPRYISSNPRPEWADESWQVLRRASFALFLLVALVRACISASPPAPTYNSLYDADLLASDETETAALLRRYENTGATLAVQETANAIYSLSGSMAMPVSMPEQVSAVEGTCRLSIGRVDIQSNVRTHGDNLFMAVVDVHAADCARQYFRVAMWISSEDGALPLLAPDADARYRTAEDQLTAQTLVRTTKASSDGKISLLIPHDQFPTPLRSPVDLTLGVQVWLEGEAAQAGSVHTEKFQFTRVQ